MCGGGVVCFPPPILSFWEFITVCLFILDTLSTRSSGRYSVFSSLFSDITPSRSNIPFTNFKKYTVEVLVTTSALHFTAAPDIV